VAITLLAGASAFAQQSSIPAEPALEEVVVTGSRIAQTVAQSTQPLSVISAEQISKTGLASVGDLGRELESAIYLCRCGALRQCSDQYSRTGLCRLVGKLQRCAIAQPAVDSLPRCPSILDGCVPADGS
jgi:outer membrane cobalamin receptor